MSRRRDFLLFYVLPYGAFALFVLALWAFGVRS